jgi:hypothetical protein
MFKLLENQAIWFILIFPGQLVLARSSEFCFFAWSNQVLIYRANLGFCMSKTIYPSR